MKIKEPTALADAIKASIRSSRTTARQIAKECSIPTGTLSKFLSGSGISLTTAEKLAAHFGLTLTKTRKRVE